jgi:hypothetical protein
MKTPKLILPLIVTFAISASGAPDSAVTGAPAVGGSASNTQQPGNKPDNNVGNGTFVQPGGVPGNNVGNGAFAQPGFVSGNNGGNGTFVQPGSPPVAGQTFVTNKITGQNITGQNMNQSGLGTRQQYNQQGLMTNRPPLQTNDSQLQPGMTNHPSILMGNTNMPPQ